MKMIEVGKGFSSLHPGISFTYFVILILLPMIFRHPQYLGSILLFALLLNIFLDRGKALRKNSRFYLFMAAIISVFNPLFSQRGATILFYLGYRPVTLESTVFGILLALSLLSILIIFLAYNQVITPDRFLLLFSSAAPKTAFIITVTLRFIPLIKERLQEIMFVQEAMGAFSLEKTKRQKAREAVEVLSILVTWSLEASLQTAASMRSRGYESGKRSSALVYPGEKRDLLWLLIILVTGGGALLGGFWGYGQLKVYPQLSAITPLGDWPFIFLLFFLFIPVYMEGRELIQWHFIRSKI